MNREERIAYLTERVISDREYADWCLKERALYEADRERYAQTCHGRHDNALTRGSIQEQLGYVCQGIYPTIYSRAEIFGQDTEAKLATLLGCPPDQPFVPFITGYLQERDR